MSDSLNGPIRGQASQAQTRGKNASLKNRKEVKSILFALTFSVPEIATRTEGEKKDAKDPALGAHSPA